MPRFKVKKPEVKMEEDCRYTVITEEVVSNKSSELEDKVEKSGLSISRNTNDPETSMQSRSMDQVLSKMDKGRKIIEGKQSIDLGSETKSSLKSMEIDGENKSAEITNICEENSRMKTEEGNNIDRHRSADNITAEADAIFRKAIKDMQFDRGANECSNTDGNSLEINRDKNSIEDVGAIINIGTNIEAPPRRAKLQSYREKDTKLSEDLITDQNTAKKKYEIDNVIFNDLSKEVVESQCSTRSNFFVSREDGDRSELGEKFLDHPYSRRWSSLENLRKTEVCEQYPKLQTSKASSTERKVKEKRTIGSLKTSLEKKMESVERKLEDRIERIWEVNVEKHPWLLPIESWIVDRCKSSGTYTVPHDKCSIPLEGEEAREKERRRSRFVEQSLEFKFTAAEKEDEEAKIESRVVEHLKKLRKTGSPKAERSVFDTANLISRLKRTENCSETTEDKNQPIGEVEGVLEMKDVKPHNYDLFDKLKDNVKGKMEDIHRYFQRTNRLADVNRRLKSQIWSSVVTIVLVEARNLLPMDIDGLSDPYVKFRLGTEKYKSKVVNKTLNPVWLEQFDLHLYEDPHLGQELEVTVWDRDRSHQDDLMGRTLINLAALERETTHRLWRDLEDGSGSVFLLLTISGTTASETISDLAAHEETTRERDQIYQRYSFMNTLQRLRDVGHLTVKVFRAQGLAAADLGGKSDPFCVLELVNARLQTQTEYKTLAPCWQKIFTFNVKDINSVLEVTVYDEDRDHKVEFLGKVAIPLLRIRNGEKRWYALKDKKLRGRAKGSSPQILLELTVVWNVFRACIRTLNPKEKKYMEPEIKFKRQVFLRNVLRLKAIIIIFIDIGKYIQSCWEWESKMRSIIALVIFILGCYYFEPYMIPGAALLILLRYYLLNDDGSGFNQWISGQVAMITGAPLTHHSGTHLQDDGDDGPATPGDDDDDEDDKDKEEKKSLKERLQAIQEVTQTVQNSIGYIASLCERVKNLFNFTVPYLSYLAMILAILGAAVLYFIPVRYLILVWGVNKFSRKIFRPHSVPNNEILDLISRVPDDEELLNYRELKPLPTADCERGGTSGSPGTSNLTRREQRKRHKAA